jgi:hypothetical protein
MRLDEIPTFAYDRKAFRVVVESPRGSSVKLHASHPFPTPTASLPVSLPHSLLQCASCHVCEHA